MLRVHSCYKLHRIVKVRGFENSKLTEVLESIINDPFEAKAASGKEAALALHSLGEIPDPLRGSPAFKQVTDSFVDRALKIIGSSMNEKSIVIAFIGISRLSESISPEKIDRIFESLGCIMEARPIKSSRNLSNLVYSIAHMNNCSDSRKARALNGWVSERVILLSPSLHVKDIVQLISAYRVCGVKNIGILSLLESTSLRQVQYMDSRTLSAIMSGFSRLQYVPSQVFAETFLITLAQCLKNMNCQSFCCSVLALSFWSESKLTLCRNSVESVLSKFPEFFDSIPLRSLGPVLNAVNDLRNSMENLSVNLDFVHVRLGRIISRLKTEAEEKPWLIADIGDALVDLSPAISTSFVDELIYPILTTRGAPPTPVSTLARLCVLYAKVYTDTHPVSACISDVKKHGDVSALVLLINGLSKARNSEALVQDILGTLLNTPDWDKDVKKSSLVELAQAAWNSTGEIDSRIIAAIPGESASEHQQAVFSWIRRPALCLPGSARIMTYTGEDLLPRRYFKIPPPGTSCRTFETERSEVIRRLDHIDPFFRIMHPHAVIVLTENEIPSQVEKSNVCMRMQPDTTAVLVPVPVSDEKIIKIIRQFSFS